MDCMESMLRGNVWEGKDRTQMVGEVELERSCPLKPIRCVFDQHELRMKVLME